MAAVEWEPSYEGLARFVRELEPEDRGFDGQLSLLEDDYAENEPTGS